MILDGAACAPHAPGPWDEDATLEEHQFALEVCGSCPVQRQCAQVADRGHYTGIWGGRLLSTPTSGSPRANWLAGHPQPCAPAGERWAREWHMPVCPGCHRLENQRRRNASAREHGGETRRGRPPEPLRHGSRYGFVAHRRRGEEPCEKCLEAAREAYRRAAKRRRERRKEAS